MSDKEAPTPTAKPTTLSPLDSPSSYLNASKQDKAAMKAAYSEIFKVPKKKRGSKKGEKKEENEDGDTPKKGRSTTTSLSPKKRKTSPKKKKEEMVVGVEVAPLGEVKIESPVKTNEDDPLSILRKGDLTRLDSEQTRSGRIQGGLARVTKVHPPTDGSTDKSQYCYDIEYVLGGKVSNVSREELIYTTAEAEGLVSTNLRERRSNRSATKEDDDDDNIPKKSSASKRKRDFASKRPSSRDGSISSRSSKKAPPKKKETPKAAPKRNSRRNSTDDDSSDANTTANNDSRSMDMYTKHKRELERSLGRLEKMDRFGFFFDTCPPELDEDYQDSSDDIQFPDGPPFNFVVLKKRLEAGRYDLDFVHAEVERRKEIRVTLKANTDKNALAAAKEESDAMDVDGAEDSDTELYDEVAKSMCHPIGVDWETFNKDVVGMCDAAMKRDPEGVNLGSGHLGFAAQKIKKVMDEMYTNYGCKRRAEMEASEARLKYENILNSCGNIEAAMQGKWRKQAFPERKYERLETSSVVCDGLSDMDKSYAIYELGTSIPDSFVGLAYTYDDSGQHSETWMKTVVDETSTKPRAKRKKKSDDSSDPEKDKNKEQSAAAALAKDDGVTKAQVQNTMQALLIQVQDKVMTDLGVMHQSEARSANWDDGDDRRNYRGGAAEVEQGSNINTRPDVAEQEVWGVDCYTRKNVMSLIESEFTPEIAAEFMEKWLLPAINACPVDLAHNISTAARILEGLPLISCDTDKNEGVDESKTVKKETLESVEPESVSVQQNEAAEEPKPMQQNKPSEKPPSVTKPVESNLSSPRRKAPESSVFLRTALESKIKNSGPPWLKTAARLLRQAADSLDEDDGFFRIHPKGHGSVVIGEHGLKANSLVTYYRGEVYPAWRWCEKLDAIEKTQKDLNLRPNLPDFYNMAMERPKKDPRGYGMLFVDASRKSGLGSSFSHSCNPSCEVRVVALNGKLSLAMTTLRDLEQGEELTFDYNAVTESVNEYRFAICLCGHRKCRGSFLHFASAPCYQQVLSRNCPMASRFANLVRGCMKQVMSREDSDILMKHGFNTAAFGAVSFNHRSKTNSRAEDKPKSVKDARVQLGELLLELSCSPPRGAGNGASVPSAPSSTVIPDSSEDSIENVPIWLRTYVADTLRYIEYERRALPVALLCNQMERKEQRAAQEKKEKRNKDKKPDKVVPVAADSSKFDKSKPVSGSKPTSSYFYFLACNREKFTSIVDKDNNGKIKGLDLARAANKYGAQAWNSLSQEEKQSWKEKAIEDWKKNGGQEKAKLEEKRQRGIGSSDAEKSQENFVSGNTDVGIEQKEISFADAEAEGLSAMEQRIQQLAQSLSRVGRVLDRHRESEYRKLKGAVANTSLLRNLVPCPLKIMSDEEVVNWMWNDKKGVVRNLLALVDRHFPKDSLLQKLISNTESSYPVLAAFTNYSNQMTHPSVEFKKGRNACTAADARTVLREALLEFRSDINDYLSLAEKSHWDAVKKKKNDKKAEAARRREAEKAKKLVSSKSTAKIPDEVEDETVSSDIKSNDSISKGDDTSNKLQIVEKTGVESVNDSHEPDNAMRIRGGGEDIMCSELNPPKSTEDNKESAILQDEVAGPNDVEAAPEIVNNDVKLVTAPETLSGSANKLALENDTPMIESSSTLTHMNTTNEKADSQVLHDPSGHDMQKGRFTVTDDTNIAQSTVQSSPIAALALMANLAAAVPPVAEQQNHPSTALKEDIVTQSTAANSIAPLTVGANPSMANIPTPMPTANLNQMECSSVEVKSELGVQSSAPNSMPPPNVDGITQGTGQTEPEDEPKKKKTIPMNQEQLAYLKKWLLDPNHILNPYPTEAEKNKIMNDIGVEQNHLERWLSRNRKNIILSPEKQSIPMKWKEADSSHWEKFRRQRYMLESTADLLLMYACTNTFFLLEPFNSFDSTPIEVYARELGNEVPRHLAADNKSTSKYLNTESEQKHLTSTEPKTKCNGTQEYCSPEMVITEVTVNYSEEYVVSQLLQWFNGGIGQPRGLPDIFGCVQLPPVSGCWEEIEDCSEIKVSSFNRTTEYSAKNRLLLADWIDDRTKRGSPWNEDIARYFCKDSSSPDPLMPLGSPVIDYLVTGIEDNIQFVSSALRNKDGKGIDSPARARSKTSASDRLQSTVDAGMPAQAVANWVQCENPTCLKWRKLPWHVDIDLLPEQFFCKDNIWTSGKKSCDVPEDEWDMADAPVKFDTVEEDFAVGVWFDVQRAGKVGYHEAQVVEMDFNSPVKRVKFHFWRLSNASDEWVDVGSTRIAPHHSYTPRPAAGYGVSKKNKKKVVEKNKVEPIEENTVDEKKRKADKILLNATATGSMMTDPNKKSKLEAATILPPPVSLKVVTTKPATMPRKCAPFPKSTVAYLTDWFEKHKDNTFPTQQEKLIMLATTGLNKRQLSDWLAKARKKQKLQNGLITTSSISQIKVAPKIETSAEKLEADLLLQLKGAVPSQNSAVVKTQVVGNADINSTGVVIPGVAKPNASPNALANVGLPDEAKKYLWKWIQEHKHHPFPTKEEKDKMLKDLKLGPGEIRKIEGWFSRMRKKLKSEAPTAMNGASHLNTDKNAVRRITSADVDRYCHQWRSRPGNTRNLNPNQEERRKMEAESGIESRRIESWFYRLRKKIKKHQAALNGTTQPVSNIILPPKPSAAATTTTTTTAAAPSQASAHPSKPPPINSVVVKSVASTSTNNVAVSKATQAAQVENKKQPSTASSNLDLLFEAATIHSAAREALDSQTQKNSSNDNTASQYNRNNQRPHPMNSNGSSTNVIPPGAAGNFGQGNQMRSSPVFCQPVQHTGISSRGHTPPNGHNPHLAYHDRQPHRNFVPINVPNGSADQQYRSRQPTPTFNYQNAIPAYHANESVRREDQYHRPTPTYLPQNAQHPPMRYPRPPNEQIHQMENAQYHQQYQPRYNFHNEQSRHQHHQR